PLLRLVVLLADRLDLTHQPVIRHGEQPPPRARMLVEDRPSDAGVLLEALGAGDAGLAFEHLAETAVDGAVEDRLLVVAVLGEPLDLLALDRERAFVLLDAVAVEHPYFDHRALDAW